MHFEEKDNWAVGDMLRRLRFERGRAALLRRLRAGQVHEDDHHVRADGTFMLDTVNRGEAATRWIATLQGKKFLQPISDAGAEA
jgi:hypothetical protein